MISIVVTKLTLDYKKFIAITVLPMLTPLHSVANLLACAEITDGLLVIACHDY